jgi:hypothetical protein
MMVQITLLRARQSRTMCEFAKARTRLLNQSGSDALVTMRKTPTRGHATTEHRAEQPGHYRCLFLESTPSAVLVVVIEVTREPLLQMRFADGQHVVQQFATATSYPSFRDPILPRRGNRGPHTRDLCRAAKTKTGDLNQESPHVMFSVYAYSARLLLLA